MEKFRFLPVLLLLFAVLFVAGCSGKAGNKTEAAESAVAVDVPIDNETLLLIKDLADNGDYVNSREFPSLIKASVVQESMGTHIHIIDLRAPLLYSQGHIQGSVNKRFEDLPEYFESGIKPFELEKIVLVCEDGQISSYATSLLRLMGYGNVFAMRWGMSAWNTKLAEAGWLKGLSAKYEQNLEKTTNEKPVPKGMPELETGLSLGEEISSARFKSVFAEGTANVLIEADQVFENPHSYFVINYERKDKYDDAHVPGAVRYKPNATLGFTAEMSTIPTDKIVVMYCGTGHNSAFATAYLRLFGYDARTLKYGNNSFMVDWMRKDEAKLSWLPFSEKDIHDFSVVK
ncbi:MAG: rhodanese-like domain-containing protein [Bacteroidales bacterium]|nr:rhodanese-like domain-containing protein [Bacteroidales bacterium]